jgi:hypothetical protein
MPCPEPNSAREESELTSKPGTKSVGSGAPGRIGHAAPLWPRRKEACALPALHRRMRVARRGGCAKRLTLS